VDFYQENMKCMGLALERIVQISPAIWGIKDPPSCVAAGYGYLLWNGAKVTLAEFVNRDLTVAKNRAGESAKVHLVFDRSTMRFSMRAHEDVTPG
jgi:replicative DNA helicase